MSEQLNPIERIKINAKDLVKENSLAQDSWFKGIYDLRNISANRIKIIL